MTTVPTSLEEAQQMGFQAQEYKFNGCPEDGTVSGETLFTIEAEPEVRTMKLANGTERTYPVARPPIAEISIPYTATYQFGKPRALRASDKF